jgi:hypothetical protein
VVIFVDFWTGMEYNDFMICVAAFIVLLVISVPVLGLSVVGRFNPRVKEWTAPYWRIFKKAWYCVGRRVTFRACDSSFKDDVKNSVLSRLVLRHKKWVKPVGVGIEVMAVVIVGAAIWSLVEVGKAGLSLYVYGTCNVTQPEACILGEGDVCSTEEASGRNAFIGWFEEWGELFGALPARMQRWEAEDYVRSGMTVYGGEVEERSAAIDIFDPGCINCYKSFNNQLNAGFFEKYNTYLIPYPIKSSETEDGYRFPNSYLIASYMVAAREFEVERIYDSADPMYGLTPEWYIVYRLFTGKDEELGVDFQSAFNGVKGVAGTPYSAEKAEGVLRGWLAAWYGEEILDKLAERAHSEGVREKIEEYRHMVDEVIQTKGIPTTIFEGRRHIGVWRE